MTPRGCVRHFESRFRVLGDGERAVAERAYMKSKLRFHGIAAKELRAECAAFCRSCPKLDRTALFSYVDALFATNWFDLHSAAIALLERNRRLLAASDMPAVIELARRAACWAHVDYLVTKVIGPVLDGDLALSVLVRTWAKDRSFWIRRVALLAQLSALRRGQGNFALFSEIAAPMLDEREFFVRKAIGWVLREVAKKRPGLVRDFLRSNAPRCAGVTWREAIKYLPDAMRRQAETLRTRAVRDSSVTMRQHALRSPGGRAAP